ncbi:MAG: M28 family peptidase [Nocardioidaceae bacterium]|nr:M28 family peptidase [Nocardioidaceae bacterium]
MLLPVLLLAACTGAPEADPVPSSPPPSRPVSASATPGPTPPTPAEQPVRTGPRPLRAGTAMLVVRHLAGTVGPGHATSPAFRRAESWVARRLAALGYDVRRQHFRVPAGVSWGVRVGAGRSANVLAAPAGFDPRRPHLVLGAHLDTVPQAPGAEDNASGVGVLLAVAEAVAGRRTRLPVLFVAFGAEEPRGAGDDHHHYGSRHYVAGLGPAERRAVRGMVSLDRVGVGPVAVVSSTGPPDPARARVLAAARRAGVPVAPMTDDRASDHWSFVLAGMPGTRVGSTPYAAYHSTADRVGVVEPAQLRRSARLALAWVSG